MNLVFHVIVVDVDLLDLGDLLEDEMLLEGQCRTLQHILLHDA